MLSLARLESLLAAAPQQRIALVGDLFLDRYLWLAAGEERSIETGLEAYQVVGVRNAPGALGTVMNNLAALGVGQLLPVTVIGDDGHGHDLLRALGELPVDTTHILASADRLTPTYTKPMQPDGRDGWRELSRLDFRTRAPLGPAIDKQLAVHLRQAFHACDGLIVLDQIVDAEQGVVNAATRACLAELAHEDPHKLIYVDSRAFLGLFPGLTIKGNSAEILRATHRPSDAAAALEAAARELAAANRRTLFCTVGERGVLVVSPDGRIDHAAGIPVPGPLDIVGAGDSATSGMVLSLLAGATPLEAAEVGNLVASITIQQLGTTGTATPQQVLARRREQGA